MVLLWFVLGIVLAFGIARYNESNKLFWTLLFSFVMGFAGTKMVLDSTSSKEKNNSNLTQVCSTQMQKTTLSTITYYITNDMSKAENVVTAQQSVSQGYTPATCETDVVLSKISGRTRDQPQLTLIKPPEIWQNKEFFNTS